MKRRTFYHLSLAFPYLVLILSLAIGFLMGWLDDFINTPFDTSILVGMIAFFAFSAFIWGPLYTWMVIVMLIWSRGRSLEDVRRLYLLSPVLLACSMGIPIFILNPLDSGKFILEGTLRMNHLGFLVPVLIRSVSDDTSLSYGMVWMFMAVICLVVGYAFVGIALWVEKMLLSRGKFKDEPSLENTLTE